MKVRLKSNFFAPDGRFLRKHTEPYDLPDSWRDKLPRTATVLEEPKAQQAAEDAKATVSKSPEKKEQ